MDVLATGPEQLVEDPAEGIDQQGQVAVLGKEVNLAFLQRVSTEDLGLTTRQLATLL